MRFSTTLILTLVLSGGTVFAQDAIVEGKGYTIGEGTVLHTNVGVESGIDSNVFYMESNTVVAPILRVIAAAAIASEHNQDGGRENTTPSGEDEKLTVTGEERDTEVVHPVWDFRLGLQLGYDQYLGFGHAEAVDFDINQQSNLHGSLDAHVIRNPKGTFSYFLDNRLVRDTRPRNFISAGNLNRWTNQLALGGHWRPGRGALDFSLRYENLLDRFDNKEEAVGAALANRLNHLLKARAEWQFLPITRFFFEGSLGLFGPLGANSEKVGSLPLRLRLGVASLVTEATSVRAHVGFGKGFYSAGQDFTMAIFGGEFGLRYSPVGRFTIAYEYDFHDSINSNFYRDHAILGKLDHQFGRFLLDASVQFRIRGYRGVFASVGLPSRDDVIVGTQAKVHYLTRDWLAFTALANFVLDATSYRSMSGGVVDDPSYARAEFLVGADAAF